MPSELAEAPREGQSHLGHVNPCCEDPCPSCRPPLCPLAWHLRGSAGDISREEQELQALKGSTRGGSFLPLASDGGGGWGAQPSKRLELMPKRSCKELPSFPVPEGPL